MFTVNKKGEKKQMKILKKIKNLILATAFIWLPVAMCYIVNILFDITLN